MKKKTTLNLKQLLDEGIISQEEAEKLTAHSENKSNSSILRNLMIVFGTICIVGSLLSLLPNPDTVGFVSLAILGGAYYLYYNNDDQSWRYVAQSIGFLGTIGATYWILTVTDLLNIGRLPQSNTFTLWLLISGILSFVTFTLHNKVLAALFSFSLAQFIGTCIFGKLENVFIFLSKGQSTAILIYGLVTLLAYIIAPRLKGIYDNLFTIIGNTSFFFANLAFWAGSVFGEKIDRKILKYDDGSYFQTAPSTHINENLFIVGWIITLLLTLWWGSQRGVSYITNISIVFLVIHFFTQYFIFIGSSALGMLIGGILLFATALAWHRHKN